MCLLIAQRHTLRTTTYVCIFNTKIKIGYFCVKHNEQTITGFTSDMNVLMTALCLHLLDCKLSHFESELFFFKLCGY